jgi:hypothetical protein
MAKASGFVATALLGALILAALVTVASAEAGSSGITPTETDSLRHSLDRAAFSQTVETTVVEFRLNGEAIIEYLEIPDLDIVFSESGERLLPLVRICRALEYPLELNDNQVRIQPDRALQFVLSYHSGEWTLSDSSGMATIRTGISDVTFLEEIYVQDHLVGLAFGIEMNWYDDLYSYECKSIRKPPLFQRLREERLAAKPGGSSNVERIGIDLPELLPPARPPRFGSVALSPGFQVSVNSAGTATLSRRLDLQGRFLTGSLSLELTQYGNDAMAPVELNSGSWTARASMSEFSLGDVSLGLSSLAFPSMSFTGLRMNGLLGVPDRFKEWDRSQLGLRDSFVSSEVFQGTAAVGSEVELWVNGRFIDAVAVQPVDTSLVYGKYEFEETVLPAGRLNDIRIVITSPEGTQTERYRRILASDRLLGRGQLAYLTGVGTRRYTGSDQGGIQGLFAGGRALFGITDRLTLGTSVAWQRDALSTVGGYAGIDADRDEPPDESLHQSLQLSWRVFDPLVISGEVARSESEKADMTGGAARLNGDIYFGKQRVELIGFGYSPDFFDGRNTTLYDKAGYAASAFLLTQGRSLNATVGQVQDNVEDQSDSTRVESFQTISVRTGLPLMQRASVGLSFTNLDASGLGNIGYASVYFQKRFRRSTRFKVTVVRGDDLSDILNGNSLTEGLRIPNLDLFRRPGEQWELGFSVSDVASMSLRHIEDPERTRSLLGINLRGAGDRKGVWRIDSGYDWDEDEVFWQNTVECYLDQTRGSKVGVRLRYERGAWSTTMLLSLKGMFGFIGGNPTRLPVSGLSRRVGGVKGQVFMDLDCDGILDSGEPGVGDVGVLADGRRKVEVDGRGRFVVTSGSQTQSIRISLDPRELPAFYTPTHGTQMAFVEPGTFTEVNLGIAAFGFISGNVYARLEDGETEPVTGARVVATDQEGNVLSESISASDGSYYLGDVKPGLVTVKVDTLFLDDGYTTLESTRQIDLPSGMEPVDIEEVDLLLLYSEPQVEEKDEEAIPTDVEYKRF